MHRHALGQSLKKGFISMVLTFDTLTCVHHFNFIQLILSPTEILDQLGSFPNSNVTAAANNSFKRMVKIGRSRRPPNADHADGSAFDSDPSRSSAEQIGSSVDQNSVHQQQQRGSERLRPFKFWAPVPAQAPVRAARDLMLGAAYPAVTT